MLAALLAFRVFFGLSAPLFTEDETQIYLLGLRLHASHAWPYFGPDVVWTETQIPGALQALLVGLPFDLAPIPEAPYLLLNVLSMGALMLFAWYLSARLPDVPRWLIWGWLLTLPWTLELSTHIINPSYVLPASLVFFVAFCEAWPPLRIGRVPLALCYAAMGAALGWVAQIHMSWPLLVPFIALAVVARRREGWRAVAAAGATVVAGAALTGSLIVPTWATYGLFAGGGSTGDNVVFHWREPIRTVVETLGRMLAFASYEVNRFIAGSSAKRLVFLQDHWWLVPPVAVLWITGILHPVWMAATAFRRKTARAEWPAVRWLMVGTVALVSASFFFTIAWAQARSFYVVAPVAFLYAAYCWTFVDSRRMRRLAAVVLAANLVLQVSLASSRLSGPSLYMNRPLLVDVIERGDTGRFGHRRPWGRDVTSDALASSVTGADPAGALVIERADRTTRVQGIVAWNLVVHNRSSSVAYRDLMCETTYYGADGQILETHREFIWVVIQPGESRRAQVIDGARWTTAMARADVRVVDARPLQPLAPAGASPE